VTASARSGLLWALAAILFWGTLAAAVGDALQGVRPAELVFLCFLFSAPTLLAIEVVRGRPLRAVYAPDRRAVAMGLVGVFGYHALFFFALDKAPIVEANLLNYLWPLFMVLLAPLVARERFTLPVLLGALAGFVGAALVVTQGARLHLSPEHAEGYAMAALAAVAWAAFSVGLKRLGNEGEDRMALFTLVSLGAALALAAVLGDLSWPSRRVLLAAAWVGAGPMGIAFFCWNRALSQGSASRIGALSYLDPLLSTLAVSFTLGKPITGTSWLGMALIIGGAAAATLLSPARREEAASRAGTESARSTKSV
jgi:drug/metabolite transporter (DMT)-like permease